MELRNILERQNGIAVEGGNSYFLDTERLLVAVHSLVFIAELQMDRRNVLVENADRS
jgi:hypothetical protein